MAKKIRPIPKNFYAVVAHVYKQLGGRIKRKVRGNPNDDEFNALVGWYSDFHGRIPRIVDTIRNGQNCMPAVVAELGSLLAIEYEVTLSDGEKVTARHEFGRKKPRLVCDSGGEQLWIIEGQYKITSRGIEG